MATKKTKALPKVKAKRSDVPRKAEQPVSWARRLIFDFNGANVKMVSEHRLAMVAPPPQSLLSRPDERGFWVELRDDKNLPVYRRAIDRPMQSDLEVVVDDKDRPLARIAAPKQTGTFFVIVPDLASARQVVFRGETAKAGQKAGAMADLHRFDLRKIAKGN